MALQADTPDVGEIAGLLDAAGYVASPRSKTCTPTHTEESPQGAEAIGVASIDDLFNDLPSRLRNPHIDMAPGMDESTLLDHMKELAAKNVTAGADFLGGGVTRHFMPSVTPHLALQSEFVTAYTPYQPEVAQGILQATFEYQTIMSELTGLPVSNASMSTAPVPTAESALLAVRQTGRTSASSSAAAYSTRDTAGVTPT